ncbi:hypothetical protein M0802_001852 [Mischocyttarus mexicanus]|nr:hypothetical protein M0802_001852 [Mischocyttarus mexicanus]
MGEVLKAWFRRRLGILIELTPELFGHYTRDGHLLAQILHSYGIINCDQLDTIIQTKDPTLCRVNLKHLRIWLRFIGVDCTDDCIEEISCGKGATALQLFYKVYLSLEDKDSLYFITLQKEREKYIPSSRKFDVIPVSEEPVPYEQPDHPLSKPLTKSVSTIEWHRNKFQKILESCRKDRKKLRTLKKKDTSRKIDLIEHIPSKTFCETNNDDVFKEMNDFARKHRVKPTKRDIYDPCLTEKNFYDEIEVSAEDSESAKAYISWLKNRKRKDNIENSIKSRTQNLLLTEFWNKLSKKEDQNFDKLLASRVLDQSHYEKQMVTKLSEVRNQKNIMTENRRIVDELMLDAKENKARLEQERMREERDWEYEDVDIEYRRLCELHRRIRKEKLNKLREKHERICRETLKELIDVVVKVAEYRRSNEGCVPKAIWDEWKTLFLKCQPIFDPLENEFAEGGEEEEEEIEEIVQSRLDREEVLNEANFESYHTLQSPWDEYVPPKIDSDIEEILKLGELVLGYIVHRLLEFVYPYPVGPLEAPVPKVKTAAIILGVVERRLYNSIQMLLEKSGIRLVSMEDAINYCLSRYKEEMSDVKYIDENIIKATEDIINKRSINGKRNKVFDNSKNNTARSKKTLRSGKTSARRKDKIKDKDKDKDKGLEDKETQTPRVIPYDDMDPILRLSWC